MGKMKSLGVNIDSYDSYSQAAIMLCPTNAKEARNYQKVCRHNVKKNREQVGEGARAGF